MITQEKLNNASVDLQTVEDVINGPADLNGNGGVTSRLGTALKTFAKLIAEFNAAFTVAINNAYAQVVTGGAPILSSESAAQLPAIPSGSVTNKQIVNLKGWYTANDGGGLTLIYDSTSTATVNCGTVFPGPGGTVSFDANGVYNGTPGTGRYLSLEKRRLKPEQFGAKGDGVTDDSKALKRCVDYAANTANCSIELSPAVSYGLGSTLVIPVGTAYIEMKGSLGDISTFGGTATFLKLADILAIEVLGEHYLHNFRVQGRGSLNPNETPANTETKPGIVLRNRVRMHDVGTIYCSGLADGTEVGTDGYAIGIVQPVGGNCNYCDLKNINITAAKDGVYIGRQPGAANNINSIKVGIDSCTRFTKYALNAEGGVRNHYSIKHASSIYGSLGTFRLNGTDSHAYNQYSEGNVPLGVMLPGSARRNLVQFLDTITFTQLFDTSTTGSTSNVIESLAYNTSFGQPAQNDFGSNSYGTAFDIQQNAILGNVTWTKRVAVVASLGKIVNISLEMTGSSTVSSTADAYVAWDLATFNCQPVVLATCFFPVILSNSAGTQTVYLQLASPATNYMKILKSDFTDMSFDELKGTGTFSLFASFTIKRANAV